MKKQKVIKKIKGLMGILSFPVNFSFGCRNAINKQIKPDRFELPNDWELLPYQWLLPAYKWLINIHQNVYPMFNNIWRGQAPVNWRGILDHGFCDETVAVIELRQAQRNLRRVVRRRKNKPQLFLKEKSRGAIKKAQKKNTIN